MGGAVISGAEVVSQARQLGFAAQRTTGRGWRFPVTGIVWPYGEKNGWKQETTEERGEQQSTKRKPNKERTEDRFTKLLGHTIDTKED